MDGWMDGRMDRRTLFYRTLMAEARGSKRKKVFSLINAGWIVSRILYIFFNVNQINSCIYLTMKLLVIIFMLMILTEKNYVLLNLVQEFIEIEAWLHHAFFIYSQNNFY